MPGGFRYEAQVICGVSSSEDDAYSVVPQGLADERHPLVHHARHDKALLDRTCMSSGHSMPPMDIMIPLRGCQI